MRIRPIKAEGSPQQHLIQVAFAKPQNILVDT